MNHRLNSIFAAVLILLVSAIRARPLDAQVSTARNAIYAELGGNGLVYSINYDRRFKDGMTGRVGLMFLNVDVETDSGELTNVDVAFMPLMVNWLLGTGSGRLELGVGPVLGFSHEEGTTENGDVELNGFGLAAVSTTAGFRYQPEKGGLVFRATLTPFYSGSVQLWGGLSLGYAF